MNYLWEGTVDFIIFSAVSYSIRFKSYFVQLRYGNLAYIELFANVTKLKFITVLLFDCIQQSNTNIYITKADAGMYPIFVSHSAILVMSASE